MVACSGNEALREWRGLLCCDETRTPPPPRKLRSSCSGLPSRDPQACAEAALTEVCLSLVNVGDYIEAVLDRNLAENISRVLYPNDNVSG